MYEHFSKKIFKKRDAQSFKLGCVAWLRCAHGASLTWASNTSCPCASSQTCTSPHVAVVLTQPRLCGLYNSSNYWLWIKNQNPFHGYVLDSPRQAAALIRSFVVASRVWKKTRAARCWFQLGKTVLQTLDGSISLKPHPVIQIQDKRGTNFQTTSLAWTHHVEVPPDAAPIGMNPEHWLANNHRFMWVCHGLHIGPENAMVDCGWSSLSFSFSLRECTMLEPFAFVVSDTPTMRWPRNTTFCFHTIHLSCLVAQEILQLEIGWNWQWPAQKLGKSLQASTQNIMDIPGTSRNYISTYCNRYWWRLTSENPIEIWCEPRNNTGQSWPFSWWNMPSWQWDYCNTFPTWTSSPLQRGYICVLTSIFYIQLGRFARASHFRRVAHPSMAPFRHFPHIFNGSFDPAAVKQRVLLSAGDPNAWLFYQGNIIINDI